MGQQDSSGAGSDRAAQAHTRRHALTGAAALGAAALAELAGATPAGAATPPTLSVQEHPFNARGNGRTDDARAIQAALDAAGPGGKVVLPRGTYVIGHTLTLPGHVTLVGAGVRATTLRLRDHANTTMISSPHAAALSGTQPAVAPHSFRIQDLTLDGNKAHNARGDGLRVVAYGYSLQNVVIRDFRGLGLYSELNGDADSILAADSMEAWISQLKVHGCNGGGIVWDGPHDSMFSDVVVFLNGPDGVESGSRTIGIDVRSHAPTLQMTNCHVWGRNQQYALRCGATVYAFNTQLEGAEGAQMLVAANECEFIGGRIFSARPGDLGVGIQVGDGVSFPSATVVMARIDQCSAGLVDFRSDGGQGRYLVESFLPRGIAFAGTPVTDHRYRNRIDLHATQPGGLHPADGQTVTPATLGGAWSNVGGAYEVAGYTRGPDDRVHLRGAIRGGVAGGTTLFTLPAGLRPRGRLAFAVPAPGGASARVDVAPDGSVTVESLGTGADPFAGLEGDSSFLSLSGISFLADGS